MSMSQNDIINKLMKQWQRDVDKYRHELKKYQTELEQIKKEMASLKAVKESPVQAGHMQAGHVQAGTVKATNVHINPAYLNPVQVKPVQENIAKELPASEKAQPVSQPASQPAAQSVSQPVSQNVTYQMEQRAEIFFDYTVMFSENDEEIIVYANLHMKNTGNVQLENPLICIRVEPPGLAKLSGKILPPNAVEAMGVYTLDGAMEGWVFMKKGEDWEKDVKKGEYWIQSLQPMVIPPGHSEALNGFQFVLPRDKSQKRFVVNGIVFLNNTQYVSNNKISLQLI